MIIDCNDELVLDVACFCANELDLENSLSIEVKPMDLDGFCYSSGLIEINSELREEEKIVAICHEMIHAQQYEQVGVANEDEAYTKEIQLSNAYLKHWRYYNDRY